MHGPSETYKRPARKSGAHCWGETLLSPRRTAFFSPLTIRHLERKLLTMKKTYVLIQAPCTVIYAEIFPYV